MCVVWVRAHVCVRTRMAAMHSVRGLWEWDRRAALLNGASRARSSGESPQTPDSRPATQRGIRPEKAFLISNSHSSAPTRTSAIILPSVSFTDAGNKMFTPFLTFFPLLLLHLERLLITLMFLRTLQKRQPALAKRLHHV